MGKKKPQGSGRRLLGLQFKAITREELCLLTVKCCDAAMQVHQYVFLHLKWKNDNRPHSRCSQMGTSLRIRRGLLGGGPRHFILREGLLSAHSLN